MSTSFPGETKKYRAARDKLLREETELRRALEAVAAARRALPQGGKVPENYVFDVYGPEGDPIKVTLAELFAPGKDTLFIYNMMFPRSPDRDHHGESDDGTQQLPMMNVFRRNGGTIRHAWAPSFSSSRPTPVRTRGTATRSTRCGTSST